MKKKLRFYEEDIKFLKSKCKEDIIFQKNGVSNHTSKVAMKFIEDNFYINELNEEEKKIKKVKKAKQKNNRDEQGRILTRQYDENLVKHQMKLEDFEEKELAILLTKPKS